MSLTTAERKEIVSRVSKEAYGGGNVDVIDEYFAADFVSHNPVAGDVHGPADYKEFVGMLRTAFPDMTLTVEDQLAEGDLVAERHVAAGTHEGPFMDVEPTGASVSIDGMVLVRFEDGEIAEEWALADMMGLMADLGVVERPGQ